MSFTKPFLKNLFSLGFIQASNLLLPLMVIPLLISRIGTAEFGRLAFIQATMFFLSAIVDFGFIITGTRKVAKPGNTKAEVSSLFSTSLALRGIIMLLIFIVMCLLILCIPGQKDQLNFYFLAFAYVVGQWLLSNWIFHGFQKIHISAIVILIGRLIFFISVFIFSANKNLDIIYIAFFGIGNLVSGIIAMIIAYRMFHLSFTIPSKTDIKKAFKENVPVSLGSLSIHAYLYFNIIFLKIFTNDLMVGFFAIADRIIQMCRQMLSIYSQATFPQVCALIGRKFQLRQFFRKIYFPFLALVILLSLGLSFYSDLIIKFFITGSPGEAPAILSYLAFVPLIVCLNIPANQLAFANDKRLICFQVVLAALIISLVLNMALGYLLGVYGIVLSIIITELFISIMLNLSIFKLSSNYEFAMLR